jgi:hypothetical protein
MDNENNAYCASITKTLHKLNENEPFQLDCDHYMCSSCLPIENSDIISSSTVCRHCFSEISKTMKYFWEDDYLDIVKKLDDKLLFLKNDLKEKNFSEASNILSEMKYLAKE